MNTTHRANSGLSLRYADVSEALPDLSRVLLDVGEEVGSRQGEPTTELLHTHITLTSPLRREVLAPGRKASLPAQIAETMWVLAGRNDVEWLSAYLPRAYDFSDDGETWSGGYGPRLRAWPDPDGRGFLDQLAHVVELLTSDHSTRRAVMSIYDPSRDSAGGKDVPCNDFLMFISRNGELDLHVTTRSNDLWWGWSGINAFEWSALLEVVAHLVGAEVGELHFTINSLHLYGKHWKRAREMTRVRREQASGWPSGVPAEVTDEDRARFRADSLGDLDRYLRKAFKLEARIREAHDIHLRAPLGHKAWTSSLTVIEQQLDRFPEPMLRSWLQCLAWWWLGDARFLSGLPQRLSIALQLSPTGSRPKLPVEPELVYYRDPSPVEPSFSVVPDTLQRCNPETGLWETVGYFERATHDEPDPGELAVTTEAVNDQVGARPHPDLRDQAERVGTRTWSALYQAGSPRPDPSPAAFVREAAALHAQKHAAYGDSWKRRGELVSILANVWRKVDRLTTGGETDDETQADTAVDLLIYLVKYRLWLTEEAGAPAPVRGVGAETEPVRVELVLRSIADAHDLMGLMGLPLAEAAERFIVRCIVADVEAVEALAKLGAPNRHQVFDRALPRAFRLAYHYWRRSQ